MLQKSEIEADTEQQALIIITTMFGENKDIVEQEDLTTVMKH